MIVKPVIKAVHIVPMGLSNAFLIEGDDGLTLIDAGFPGSWSVIASNDRSVPPELQKAAAAAMKATSITVPPSHVVMLSHRKEVADLIEQAAAKAESD